MNGNTPKAQPSVAIDMQPLLDQVDPYSMIAANRLRLAIAQLSSPASVQEYQQIGIAVRDSWVELAQSLFRLDFCVKGENVPGQADAKKMIKYTLQALHPNPSYLVMLSHSAYDLANSLQHDLNATREAALWCLCSTIVVMLLIIDLAVCSKVGGKSPYYKCPHCGSIRLETKDYWHVEDGAWRLDKLVCIDCGWYYIEGLGGLTGID